MRFIKNILERRLYNRLNNPDLRNQHPLIMLSDAVRLLHTLYHAPLSIEDAETTRVTLNHNTVYSLLDGLRITLEAVRERNRPKPYTHPPEIKNVSLYDFCLVDFEGNYMSPQRIVAVIYPLAKELSDLLSEVDESSESWTYLGRLVNFVTKDILALAIGIYGVKQNNDKT